MTVEQEQHLQKIKRTFGSMVEVKYRKGQAEHGGNLFDMTPIQLIDAALDEAIDQVTYLKTLRDKLAEKEKAPVKIGAFEPGYFLDGD